MTTDEAMMFRPSLPATVERAKARRVRDRETRYAEATARLNETVARHEAAGDFEAAAVFREILAERAASAIATASPYVVTVDA